MAKEFDDLYQCLRPVSARNGYNYLNVSIKLMEAKPDDCEEFKETEAKDMDMTAFSKEVSVDVAEDGKDPVMVRKRIITDEVLYKAAAKKLEEENKENRARKNKYHKDSRLFLTSIKGQIETTIFSLIMGQPGYKEAHRKGKLIDCLKIIQTYCNGGGSSGLRYKPMQSMNILFKLAGWEQQGKSTAVYQVDPKTKLTTLKSVDGPFPCGTAYLMEVLRRNNVKYEDYKLMSEEDKKPFEA